jgi:hypothetical protein
VNAWAELASMLAGFAIALLTYLPLWGGMGFGLRLTVTAFGAAAVWMPVMWLTPPESDETLDGFYRRVRPGGPGWKRSRARTGLAPDAPLRRDLARTLFAAFLLFGAMFALGAALLLEPVTAALSALVAVVGLIGLHRLRPGKELAKGL